MAAQPDLKLPEQRKDLGFEPAEQLRVAGETARVELLHCPNQRLQILSRLRIFAQSLPQAGQVAQALTTPAFQVRKGAWARFRPAGRRDQVACIPGGVDFARATRVPPASLQSAALTSASVAARQTLLARWAGLTGLAALFPSGTALGDLRAGQLFGTPPQAFEPFHGGFEPRR